MVDDQHVPEPIQRDWDDFWIRNNVAFLSRYWETASEALRQVSARPEDFLEFRGQDHHEAYIGAVIDSHLEHHTYTGILLTYAMFDEFMTVISLNLGRRFNAPIKPKDLRDQGVKRYRKFVHQVCRVATDDVDVKWGFLGDFAVVRNAIMHANGNKSLLGSPKTLGDVVSRHDPLLRMKNEVKLVVAEEFVRQCMEAVEMTAVALNDLVPG